MLIFTTSDEDNGNSCQARRPEKVCVVCVSQGGASDWGFGRLPA